jgi:DNA processing protein
VSGVELATERAALVALLRGHTGGWAGVADEVEERRGALDLLGESLRGGTQGDLFGSEPARSLDEQLATAAADIDAWRADGLHVTTVLDADYPAQLLTVASRPPLLFYRGRLHPNDAGGVAVVGSRAPSAHGLAQAAEIAVALTERGETVISGLAAGIDTATHEAALDAGGRTVAVIGTGLRRAYPPENAALQQQIGDRHLVLSQFWPDAAPSKASFPMRNAVMSGHAQATVVVEAGPRSGARTQARIALGQGRAVFLLADLLGQRWAAAYAERPGVFVVRDAAEMLAVLDEETAPVDELAWA